VATLEGVMTVEEQVLFPVPALKATYGVRVHDDTFHYAIPGKTAPELWTVDTTGATTKLGDYPNAPATVKNDPVATSLLAPDDSLYTFGSGATDKKLQVIYRRTIDGTSEVVYSTSDNPAVTPGPGTVLITGP
jgi:hypothetical protein